MERLVRDSRFLEDVSITYGGMAPVTKLVRGAMSYMVGKTFREEVTGLAIRQSSFEIHCLRHSSPIKNISYKSSSSQNYPIDQ